MKINDKVMTKRGRFGKVVGVNKESGKYAVKLSCGLLSEGYAEEYSVLPVKECPVVKNNYEATKHLIRFDLIPMKCLEQIARVFGFGANKHSSEGWRIEGETYSSCKAALWRHYNHWDQGETYDRETGIHNLAHMITRLMFLMYYDLTGRKELDDSYKED